MYGTSSERYECFCIIFLIVCISTNFVPECQKFYIDVTYISPEGTVIFVFGFSFHFM